MGSRCSRNQLTFADPKQTGANVLKSRHDENRISINDRFSANDATNVLCWLLRHQADPDIEIDAFDGNLQKYFGTV